MIIILYKLLQLQELVNIVKYAMIHTYPIVLI
jgi:hypothetical protein